MLSSMAGIAAGGVAFSGITSATHSGVPSRLSDSFDSVVNVADAGADTSGNRSINNVLERLRDDDRLLYFPSGTYYMDEVFRFTDFENFGLYGDGATILPADYHDNADGQHKLFRLGTHYAPGRRLVVENFDVDFTPDDTGVRAFEAAISEDLTVRDITIKGRHDSGMWGPGRFVMRSSQGSGLVENFRAPGGGSFSAETPSAGRLWRGPTGLLCNGLNLGKMTFRNCRIGGFPDNGLYAGASKGPIRVEGGLFENSNGNNVRVGSPDNRIEGATIRVNRTSPQANAHRGVRLQSAGKTVIEDTRISIDVPVRGSTPLVIMSDCEGRTTLRNSRIEQNSDVFNNGVDASPDCGEVVLSQSTLEHNSPGGSAVLLGGTGSSDEWAELIYVSIRGSPGDKWNRSAIHNERNNVEFRAVDVEQGGARKRRGLGNFGDDCILYKCTFDVVQYPVIDDSAGTWVSYNTFTSKNGNEGYYLTDESRNVYLKENVIENGIRDDGCDNLKTVGNEF